MDVSMAVHARVRAALALDIARECFGAVVATVAQEVYDHGPLTLPALVHRMANPTRPAGLNVPAPVPALDVYNALVPGLQHGFIVCPSASKYRKVLYMVGRRCLLSSPVRWDATLGLLFSVWCGVVWCGVVWCGDVCSLTPPSSSSACAFRVCWSWWKPRVKTARQPLRLCSSSSSTAT